MTTEQKEQVASSEEDQDTTNNISGDEESVEDESLGDSDEEYEDVVEDLEAAKSRQHHKSLKRPHDEPDVNRSLSGRQLKLSKKELYKPPTAEELNNLKEIETLFHSSLFCLQVTELLKEVKLKDKQKVRIEQWLHQLKEVLVKCPSIPSCEVKKFSKKCCEIIPPLPCTPHESDCLFRFEAPSNIKLVGSYLLGTACGQTINVDVAVEMPSVCFQKADYLNQRYHKKRILYLSVIAGNLRSSDLVEELKFTFHHGDPLKPMLVVKPSGKAGKNCQINILPYPSAEVFKLSRFIPGKNNVRPAWFFASEETELSPEVPTPLYNSSVLKDMTMTSNFEYLVEKMHNLQGVQDGIVLLKIWLKKRYMDEGSEGFSGFIMTMLVLYLLQKRKISALMSSYQVMRTTFLFLSQVESSMNITLCTDSIPNQPTLEEFSQYYPVVFIDASGFSNLCADVTAETFKRVQHEASLALKFLDSCSSDSFDALFMISLQFQRSFDYITLFKQNDLKNAAEKLKLHDRLLDTSGNLSRAVVPALCSLIQKSLESRVTLVAQFSEDSPKWSVSEKIPSNEKVIRIGLIANPDTYMRSVDKGPPANSRESKEFRDFWGEKSELRRFQDGSILEAVVWPGTLVFEKREIIPNIIKHICQRHAGLEVTCVGDFLAPLLQLQYVNFPPHWQAYGTGEETTQRALHAYDSLSKLLRKLDDLPLAVSSVQGISPVSRFTEVFPPLPGIMKADFKNFSFTNNVAVPSQDMERVPHLIQPIQVIVHLEASGKWPDEVEAIRRVKAAFYIKLKELLSNQAAITSLVHTDSIDILKDGFVFRVQVACTKEINLLKQYKTPDGMIKIKDTDASRRQEYTTEVLPKLTSFVHGLQQQHNTFSSACRLAKRWVSAQLLADHFPDTCIDLLMVYIYFHSAPFSSPNSPRVAFQRFLSLLVTHDWRTSPLIINLGNGFTSEKYAEIQSTFTSQRTTLPAMFISTPFDHHLSPWTRSAPSGQVLHRLVTLAKESLRILEEQMDNPEKADVRVIFRPPLDPYDVIIHLHPSKVPTAHLAVDAFVDSYTFVTKNTNQVPVTGFDVVSLYLNTLKETYGNLALFFHDKYGGVKIAVLWIPKAFEPQPFKAGLMNGHKRTDTGMMRPNMAAILDDFAILGQGLVESVEVRREKWTI